MRGIQVTPLRESLDDTTWTFAGKGPAHYAAVAIAAAVLAFVLYVFVLALRTDIPAARLPWLVGVLVGVSQFAFDWTTGSLSIALLGIHVAGSDFSKASPFAPRGLDVHSGGSDRFPNPAPRVAVCARRLRSASLAMAGTVRAAVVRPAGTRGTGDRRPTCSSLSRLVVPCFPTALQWRSPNLTTATPAIAIREGSRTRRFPVEDGKRR